jgi:tetratricopeptide (TPR) repeat protein
MFAWALCRRGEPGKGIEILLPLLQALKAQRHVTYQITFLPALAEGYLLAAEYEKARQTAQEAVDLAGRYGARWFLAFARRLLGEIALKSDPTQASSHFEKSIVINKEIKAENELALAYSGMGRYHKQQGNIKEAGKYLSDALEIFERLGTLIEPDRVREELASLS